MHGYGIDDLRYAAAVGDNDEKTCTRMLREAASARGYGNAQPMLYRVDPDFWRHGYAFHADDGLFFAGDKGYYKYSTTGYDADSAFRYVMQDSARVFRPLDEIPNTYAMSWSDIRMPLETCERLGLEDENSEPDIYESGEAVTSTVGLAMLGRRLGYDATEMDIPQYMGHFREFAVYDSHTVKLFEVTYDDNEEIIPLSRRFDRLSADVRY